MINELLEFINAARQTFPGTVILIAVPTIIICLFLMLFCGKPIPEGICPCCGRKLPEDKRSSNESFSN